MSRPNSTPISNPAPACATFQRRRLMNRLVELIGRDQLVLSVLDDDSKPEPRKKGAHGYKPRATPAGLT